jgi:hypothetical protein
MALTVLLYIHIPAPAGPAHAYKYTAHPALLSISLAWQIVPIVLACRHYNPPSEKSLTTSLDKEAVSSLFDYCPNYQYYRSIPIIRAED